LSKNHKTQPQCLSKHSAFINISNSVLTEDIAISSREEARLDFIAYILCHDCVSYWAWHSIRTLFDWTFQSCRPSSAILCHTIQTYTPTISSTVMLNKPSMLQ